MDGEQLDVAVIGGGISGIAAAWQMLHGSTYRTKSFKIFEKSAEIGGTWYANTYPGAACDIPSHLYSFSFAPNHSWTRAYAKQGEIEEYLLRLVETAGIRPYVRCSTEVVSAVWREDSGNYAVTCKDTASGKTYQVVAKFVISAVGALCVPNLPDDIPGIKQFKGKIMHTAQWDHSVDLRGKTVAVVGTGASAIQVVPAVQRIAEKVYVFQRTPAWLMPRLDRPFSSFTKFIFRYVPFALWLYRCYLFMFNERNFFVVFRPLAAWLTAIAKGIATFHRNRGLRAKPELAATLTPAYPMGCKRIIVSDEFYPALCKPNVALIPAGLSAVEGADLIPGKATAPVVPGGAEVPDRIKAVQVLVLATGFDISAIATSVKMQGTKGFELSKAWDTDGPNGGPSAYLGITVAHLPNAFFCLGPNTGLGHNSITTMIELQQAHIFQLIARASKATTGKCVVEVKEEAQREFEQEMATALGPNSGAVWSKCVSWYNLGGKKNVTLWPYSVVAYWWRTRSPNLSHYSFR